MNGILTLGCQGARAWHWAWIGESTDAELPIYVHCLGGRGRTGRRTLPSLRELAGEG